MDIYNHITHATLSVILVPPDAPEIMITSPFLSRIMLGAIDDKGRILGLGEFALDQLYWRHGESKGNVSPIWLLYIIPVVLEQNNAPNLE